jgi:hypothetical protein
MPTMTEKELNAIGIIQWQLIEKNYPQPDLLLGNGFSISFSPNFTYRSLFDTFLSKCTSPYDTLFLEFGTTNFELILKYLTYAKKVNEILSLDTSLIDSTITMLKNGLIATINEIHPKVKDVDWSSIESIVPQLRAFGDIYTTNYDLYLYHITMKCLDLHRKDNSFIPYQDYFWKTITPGFLEFQDFQNLGPYKNVYYLHGALFIFNQGISDLKIRRGKVTDELIDIISSEINNNHFPLFITEGKADDKLAAIGRSNYLYFCLSNLKNSKAPLLIYGNALSDYDDHIVNALKSNPRDLVITMYPEGKDKLQLQNEKFSIWAKFNNYPKEVQFIDSRSVFTHV